MRLNKDMYIKTYEELQKKFSNLFMCTIHMPYQEFEKLTEQETVSLKIRGNEFIFSRGENNG